MEKMFEQATRMPLRVSTPAGLLSVEDLWDLPLVHKGLGQKASVCLDSIAVSLHNKLKDEQISFVSKPKKENVADQLAFEIVKHIIAVKMAEEEAAAQAKQRREQKQQLLALIAQKENDQLAGKSLDELRQMVEQLG